MQCLAILKVPTPPKVNSRWSMASYKAKMLTVLGLFWSHDFPFLCPTPQEAQRRLAEEAGSSAYGGGNLLKIPVHTHTGRLAEPSRAKQSTVVWHNSSLDMFSLLFMYSFLLGTEV